MLPSRKLYELQAYVALVILSFLSSQQSRYQSSDVFPIVGFKVMEELQAITSVRVTVMVVV